MIFVDGIISSYLDTLPTISCADHDKICTSENNYMSNNRYLEMEVIIHVPGMGVTGYCPTFIHIHNKALVCLKGNMSQYRGYI